MGLTRRQLLRAGGLSLLATACAPRALPLSPGAAPARAVAAGDAEEPLLVVIFLRGGADGLHLVPPSGEQGYASLRGSLALEEPLAFATGFGLHPAFEPLAPLVERGELAAVHAVDSPHPTRSHFEAQDFMESGALGTPAPLDGWLARALRDEADADPFGSLALASELPLTLRGSGSFAIADPASFGIAGAGPAARRELAALYGAAGDDPVAAAGRRALSALDAYEDLVGASARRPGRGSRRESLARSARDLLSLERAGLALRAVFLEGSGWDTHINQGNESGPMANRIRDLGEAMASLVDGARARRDVVLVVMTEFGRTVRPNGSRGSDHGHGGAMLVASPRVRPGVHGDWRGFEERELYEGRDLPVTTDWRSVLVEVLEAHLGRRPPIDTFPGFEPRRLSLFA